MLLNFKISKLLAVATQPALSDKHKTHVTALKFDALNHHSYLQRQQF